MKVNTGKYNHQISFGITVANFHNEYKAIILDLGIWYVEFIFQKFNPILN
jgi:hypothetical protein